MTQYLLSVWHKEGEAMPAPEDMQPIFEAVDKFNAEIQADGTWVFGGGLEMPDTATVVSATGDDVVTTDGPFAEGKEHIGGFWVISAADLDAALAYAVRASKACAQPVEVRPFQDEPEA
jgi:hypothetical protein